MQNKQPKEAKSVPRGLAKYSNWGKKWFAVDIGVVVSSVISLLSLAELFGKGEIQLNFSQSHFSPNPSLKVNETYNSLQN